MSEDLVRELQRDHLCTHLVLPLLKLNKFSFISSNVVNCYLSKDGRTVLVQVVEEQLLSRKVLLHDRFRGKRRLITDPAAGLFLAYEIPPKWYADVCMFMAGKFSKMSKAAKDTIARYSGLANGERHGKIVLTDSRLLALDRHPLLKQKWEDLLSIALSERDELLSIPGDNSYIDPDFLIVVK